MGLRLWLQAAETSFAEQQGEEISHAARAQNRELLSLIGAARSWAVNTLVFLWKSRRRWRRWMVLIFRVKSINGGAYRGGGGGQRRRTEDIQGAFCTLTAFIWSYETWKQKELRELQILFNTTALQLSQQECIVMEAHPQISCCDPGRSEVVQGGSERANRQTESCNVCVCVSEVRKVMRKTM